MFNDELSLLRYRLKLHASFAEASVVAESALTWSGLTKSLHANSSLTIAERRRHNVHVFVVPVKDELRFPVNEAKANRRRESFQREALNHYLYRNFKSRLIFFSDLDEFLDPESVRSLHVSSSLAKHSCCSPLMRSYYYGEHCPVHETW